MQRKIHADLTSTLNPSFPPIFTPLKGLHLERFQKFLSRLASKDQVQLAPALSALLAQPPPEHLQDQVKAQIGVAVPEHAQSAASQARGDAPQTVGQHLDLTIPMNRIDPSRQANTPGIQFEHKSPRFKNFCSPSTISCRASQSSLSKSRRPSASGLTVWASL